jgi:hypothetical protein
MVARTDSMNSPGGHAVMKQRRYLFLLAGFLLYAVALSSQESSAPPAPKTQAAPAAAANDAAALAKAVQNPVASLISVPLQNNSNFGAGPYNRTQDIFNIQPVIPAPLGQNWMLITRIIQPILWQPDVTQNGGGQSGFGDMNPTFFLAPAKPGKLIWGVGPTMVFPTATSAVLGQGKLSFGPSVVALVQPGHWTFGFLVNNAWSVVGSSHRPSVNQMTLQYFITYNLKKGWNISSGPIMAANWNNKASGDAADGDDTTPGGRWTIPYGGGVGRVTRLGFQPVNLSANFYGNAVHPPGSSSWGMRLQIAFLFPKKPKG